MCINNLHVILFFPLESYECVIKSYGKVTKISLGVPQNCGQRQRTLPKFGQMIHEANLLKALLRVNEKALTDPLKSLKMVYTPTKNTKNGLHQGEIFLGNQGTMDTGSQKMCRFTGNCERNQMFVVNFKKMNYIAETNECFFHKKDSDLKWLRYSVQ